MSSFTVTPDDLDAIALGGAFLGTGGGGDPYIGKVMAKEALATYGNVEVVDADEIDDDTLCVPVAMMGAPTVMIEKLPAGGEALEALRGLESVLGRKVGALICAEAGGLNSTIPFAVAAATGLPLIDGDGMGRAFPELQMVSFTLHGVKASPIVLADDKGNTAVFGTIDNHWTERLARSAAVDMGGAALIATYPMDGRVMKTAMLRGTISLIKRVGEIIAAERRAMRHPGPALCEACGGQRLIRGRIVDIERRTVGGFARGKATIRGSDEDAGQVFAVEFQNEMLVLTDDAGTVRASTPDLICALDADVGLPVTTEQLRFGLAVELIGLPADPQWRTPEGLALVGPGYFGYGHDFVPLGGTAAAG
ncbi:DUF917 domain-containing protein [Pseudoroseicyclus tamaricis]|uniref:DUF917 domain-containing protein n=1 Tax=Pseudoroseicyclus tamaricis TaxID=2705421 RepID=A0A6B2JP49_9RHOB|nr:DUF917 domain-containing protein [Pseudoroseicyclus tamaricis]NDU99837.1 DUF917 domain-containing protein [Pseudoroseicyclus tamaricis]